jgi:hypothetical protein
MPWAFLTRDVGKYRSGTRVWIGEARRNNLRLATLNGDNFFVPGDALRFGGYRRDKILAYLRDHPWSSAAQVARHFNDNSNTTSSFLLKLVQEGVLDRENGHGPRGGYGYRVRVMILQALQDKDPRTKPDTAFSRLNNELNFDFDDDCDGVD